MCVYCGEEKILFLYRDTNPESSRTAVSKLPSAEPWGVLRANFSVSSTMTLVNVNSQLDFYFPPHIFAQFVPHYF